MFGVVEVVVVEDANKLPLAALGWPKFSAVDRALLVGLASVCVLGLSKVCIQYIRSFIHSFWPVVVFVLNRLNHLGHMQWCL